MAHSSIFASTIEFNGTTWQHIYDPENPMMVKPDLSYSKVVGYTCDPVVVPGGDPQKPLHMVTVEILIPSQTSQANSGVQTDRRLLGVRVYPNKPLTLGAVKPAEMHYYVAEPKFTSNENKAQALFNAMLGLPDIQQQEAGAPEDIDRSWGSKLLGEVASGHSDEESE